MTITINTKNALNLIWILLYLYLLSGSTYIGHDWRTGNGYTIFREISSVVALVMLGFATLFSFIFLCSKIYDGNIVIFKERKIKLWRSSAEKNKIGEVLEKYGQACLSKNEYEMDRWHRQLENIGYFEEPKKINPFRDDW